MNNARLRAILRISIVSLMVAGCGRSVFDEPGYVEHSNVHTAETPACDADNGGIGLPDGFCALVVSEGVGRARHLVVRENGDIYVALREPKDGGGIAALRDVNGDGRADRVAYFGTDGGTGIHIRDGFLYHAPDLYIERFRLPDDGLIPSGDPEIVIFGFPDQRGHRAKPFEFDEAGRIYVNIGAPSNACQEPARTPGVAGQDPCPLLENHGGVWRFDAGRVGQTYADDGFRFATGIRNGVANAWNPFTHKLYVVQHGRDQLGSLWPDIYSDTANAKLPAEEFFEVDEGDDFGWPYCYYDQIQGRKLLGPEYGGEGTKVGRCADAEDPIVAFPGHWAPNDLVFYDGEQFPDRYLGGAFIAFHGSWNRAPLPQRGYNVAFVPFSEGRPSGDYEIFADSFADVDPIESPRDAKHRPMGLAIGPDGSLYISDSVTGRIWRVLYVAG